MKITEVKATVLSSPFKGHWQSALGLAKKREIVVVQVFTDEGIVGVGEAHHGSSPLSVAAVIENSFRPILIGEDPSFIEFLWEKMKRSVPYGGTLGIIGMSGIDIALWDIRGKELGTPVYKLLGAHNNKIKAYAGGLTLGWKNPEDLAREAVKYVDLEFTALKVRGGQGFEKDVKSVKAVRDAIGSNVDIMVDINTAYSYNMAVKLARELEKYEVFWLEEPLAADEVKGLSRLAAATTIPIAVGENIYTRFGYRDLIAEGAVQIVNADCTKVGGISEAKKIASIAGAWHGFFAPHILGTAIDLAANLSVLASASNAIVAEYDPNEFYPFRDELTLEPIKPNKGYLEPIEKPGLGIELNKDFLTKHPFTTGITYI